MIGTNQNKKTKTEKKTLKSYAFRHFEQLRINDLIPR